MLEHEESPAGDGGLDRRTLLKRSAVVGGAAVWATPVVQSLARPAFAAGSPVCANTLRFKYEVDEGGFDNGEPSGGSTASQCLPTGYSYADEVGSGGQIPGHAGAVEVVVADDGHTARILLPPGCVLLDGDAKAGGKRTAECEDAAFLGVEGGRNVYTVTLEREISFIAGVICCS